MVAVRLPFATSARHGFFVCGGTTGARLEGAAGRAASGASAVRASFAEPASRPALAEPAAEVAEVLAEAGGAAADAVGGAAEGTIAGAESADGGATARMLPMCVSRSSLLDAASWLQAKSIEETIMTTAPPCKGNEPDVVSRWTRARMPTLLVQWGRRWQQQMHYAPFGRAPTSSSLSAQSLRWEASQWETLLDLVCLQPEKYPPWTPATASEDAR